MARKRISVKQENKTGRNEKFHDNYTGEDMTRLQFVDKIEQSQYPNYHSWLETCYQRSYSFAPTGILFIGKLLTT
jgi:hypothetical protein